MKKDKPETPGELTDVLRQISKTLDSLLRIQIARCSHEQGKSITKITKEILSENPRTKTKA